jgi:hypothetical protein
MILVAHIDSKSAMNDDELWFETKYNGFLPCNQQETQTTKASYSSALLDNKGQEDG